MRVEISCTQASLSRSEDARSRRIVPSGRQAEAEYILLDSRSNPRCRNRIGAMEDYYRGLEAYARGVTPDWHVFKQLGLAGYWLRLVMFLFEMRDRSHLQKDNAS